MNTQQNQNEIKKKGVQVNPSRDIKYDQKEKDFSGEFGEQDQVEAGGEEVNPSELDNTEVDLDRGSAEFSGGNEQKQESSGDPGAFDQAVKNAGSKGSAQGYEGNSPDIGMSSDLGGDVSQIQQGKNYPNKKDQKGNDLH